MRLYDRLLIVAVTVCVGVLVAHQAHALNGYPIDLFWWLRR